jgi:hypothetical protein
MWRREEAVKANAWNLNQEFPNVKWIIIYYVLMIILTSLQKKSSHSVI